MSVLWWELFPKFQSMCTLRGNNVFILPGMLLNFMKFLYPWGENVISVSPGGIFLNGHMTGQPFNSVNWLVKPWSSQCCQYLTLALSSFLPFFRPLTLAAASMHASQIMLLLSDPEVLIWRYFFLSLVSSWHSIFVLLLSLTCQKFPNRRSSSQSP